jgi:hypothetical protein
MSTFLLSTKVEITIFDSSDATQSITDEQQTIANLKEEIVTLKSVLTNTQKSIQDVWNFVFAKFNESFYFFII